ncbi:MAG: hypothetical protein EXR71_20675 [Myxococcales bacterium]|nr:hypothetical protein [Myxococcales bacterium]
MTRSGRAPGLVVTAVLLVALSVAAGPWSAKAHAPPVATGPALEMPAAGPTRQPVSGLQRFALGVNVGLAVPAKRRARMDRAAVDSALAEDGALLRGLGATLVRAQNFGFPNASCLGLGRDAEALADMDSWVRALGTDLVGLGNVSPWPVVQTGSFTRAYLPRDLPAYERCVRGLVERYDGDGVEDMPGLAAPIRYWEIDNEPDLKNSLVARNSEVEYEPASFCTPEEYAAIILASSRAIRAAAPDARILAMGLFRPHAEQGQRYARDVLAVEGVPAAFDILSLHTYHDDDGERLAAGIGAVSAMVPGKPVWVTETSVTTAGGEEVQARRVAALVARAAEAGAEALFWHTLVDPPQRRGPGDSPFSTNSLLVAPVTGGPPVDKPAAAVYRRLAARLAIADLRGAELSDVGAVRLRTGEVLLYEGARSARSGGVDLGSGTTIPPGAMATAPAWLHSP